MRTLKTITTALATAALFAMTGCQLNPSNPGVPGSPDVKHPDVPGTVFTIVFENKDAQQVLLAKDPSVIGANSEVDTTSYTSLQKKSAEFVASAKSIAQFMDRDTRPDFASTVMIPAIQEFIKNPTDIDGITKNIQAQKVSIFGS